MALPGCIIAQARDHLETWTVYSYRGQRCRIDAAEARPEMVLAEARKTIGDAIRS